MVAYLIVHLDIGIPCLSQAVKQYIATTSLEVAANHCSIDDMMIMKWKSSSTNRRQRVVVKGEVSDWLTVISGVPQGSLLGSLFFIICINDLPGVISEDSSFASYADDSILFRVINSPEDITPFQDDLDKISHWCKENKMKFCMYSRTNSFKYMLSVLSMNGIACLMI